MACCLATSSAWHSVAPPSPKLAPTVPAARGKRVGISPFPRRSAQTLKRLCRTLGQAASLSRGRYRCRRGAFRGLVIGMCSLIALTGVGCGSNASQPPAASRHATTLKPPFLPTSAPPHSVARFPCPRHPGITVAIEACSARRVLALNAKANKRIRTIWSLLRDSTGRRHLVTAEQAWSTYEANECTSRSRAYLDAASPHLYVGGSRAIVEFGICEEQMTVRHSKTSPTPQRSSHRTNTVKRHSRILAQAAALSRDGLSQLLGPQAVRPSTRNHQGPSVASPVAAQVCRRRSRRPRSRR